MGMPSRKFILLGIVGLAGGALLVDQTLLSTASAGLENLGGVVQEVKKVQEIASSLESGDPAALQNLLNTLAADEGVTPGEAAPGLFGLGSVLQSAQTPEPGDGESASENPLMALLGDGSGDDTEADARQATPPPPSHRVTMILSSASGGLAMIDGNPLRAGQTVDGITLLRVHDDGVTVRENDTESFIALR